MNFITILIDSIASFVRRNPLLCLCIVMLAFLAPSVLKGIAAFALYFLLAILIMGIVIVLTIRWRLRRLQQQMRDKYPNGNDTHFGGFAGSESRRPQPGEGEVKVHVTSDTPEKRISKDVGDYVEFEETKDNQASKIR